ncbi:MAG TPA: RNA methyltransferase [Actinomycetota bacterium]
MITSPTNERVKAAAKLVHDRRARAAAGRFAVEGYRELRRALDAGVAIETIFFCPDLYLKGNEPALVERAVARGAAATEVTRRVFGKLSYRDRPEGLFAVAATFDVSLGRLPAAPTLVLVLEGIEKPGNLGAMLRTACAAGAGAVVVADPVTDVFNPNVVRSSVGMVFSIPIGVGSVEECAAWLRAAGLRLVASTPGADRPLWEVDLRPPVAIAVGSEQYGLGEALLAASDERAVIPMPGDADSLNAAASTAIALFEAVRQRAAGAGSLDAPNPLP